MPLVLPHQPSMTYKRQDQIVTCQGIPRKLLHRETTAAEPRREYQVHHKLEHLNANIVPRFWCADVGRVEQACCFFVWHCIFPHRWCTWQTSTKQWCQKGMKVIDLEYPGWLSQSFRDGLTNLVHTQKNIKNKKNVHHCSICIYLPVPAQ